jgi:hypothetical protein
VRRALNLDCVNRREVDRRFVVVRQDEDTGPCMQVAAQVSLPISVIDK